MAQLCHDDNYIIYIQTLEKCMTTVPQSSITKLYDFGYVERAEVWQGGYAAIGGVLSLK